MNIKHWEAAVLERRGATERIEQLQAEMERAIGTYELTHQELIAIFTEWARRREADPEAFYPIDEDSPDEYGPEAAEYFVELLDELTPGFAQPKKHVD